MVPESEVLATTRFLSRSALRISRSSEVAGCPGRGSGEPGYHQRSAASSLVFWDCGRTSFDVHGEGFQSLDLLLCLPLMPEGIPIPFQEFLLGGGTSDARLSEFLNG